MKTDLSDSYVRSHYPQFYVNRKLQDSDINLSPGVFKYSDKLIKNQCLVPNTKLCGTNGIDAVTN